MSVGRSASPSLVTLACADIESVSVRRRENFEIAASKAPFSVTSCCIRPRGTFSVAPLSDSAGVRPQKCVESEEEAAEGQFA